MGTISNREAAAKGALGDALVLRREVLDKDVEQGSAVPDPACGACAEGVHTGGSWSAHTCGKPDDVTITSSGPPLRWSECAIDASTMEKAPSFVPPSDYAYRIGRYTGASFRGIHFSKAPILTPLSRAIAVMWRKVRSVNPAPFDFDPGDARRVHPDIREAAWSIFRDLGVLEGERVPDTLRAEVRSALGFSEPVPPPWVAPSAYAFNLALGARGLDVKIVGGGAESVTTERAVRDGAPLREQIPTGLFLAHCTPGKAPDAISMLWDFGPDGHPHLLPCRRAWRISSVCTCHLHPDYEAAWKGTPPSEDEIRAVKLQRLVPPALTTEDECGDKALVIGKPCRCTRPRGHGGQTHVEYLFGEPVAQWPRDERAERRAAIDALFARRPFATACRAAVLAAEEQGSLGTTETVARARSLLEWLDTYEALRGGAVQPSEAATRHARATFGTAIRAHYERARSLP